MNLDDISISYALMVKDEIDEFTEIFTFLENNCSSIDEICVLQDASASDASIYYISELVKKSPFPNTKYDMRLLDTFCNQRNYLSSMCSKDYIFMIDADELIDQFLIDNIKLIFYSNPDIEMFYVPRHNVVIGITPEDCLRYGWVIDEHNRINFPDYQSRIYKNIQSIKWVKDVHETLFGYKSFSSLPPSVEYCLMHVKNIERQKKQIEFYNKFLSPNEQL